MSRMTLASPGNHQGVTWLALLQKSQAILSCVEDINCALQTMGTLLSLDIMGRVLDHPQSNGPYPL